MKKTDEALKNWRDQIDVLDAEVLKLVARRMDKVRSIGQYKKHHDLLPLSPARQQSVMKSWLKEADRLHMDPEFAGKLYDLIHAYALRLEEED